MYIGIDPSLAATCVCGIAPGAHKMATFGCQPIGASVAQRIKRYETICNHLQREVRTLCREIAGKTEPDRIAIEGYAFGSNSAHHTPIIEAAYHLRLFCHMVWPNRLIEVAPASLKKWAWGKGAGDKVAIASALTARYGVQFATSDEADAYALARMAMQIAGAEEPATAWQRDALNVVVNGKPKVVKKRKGA